MNFEDKLVNGYPVKLFEELDGLIYGVYYYAGSWNSCTWSLEGSSYDPTFNLVPLTYWRIDGARVVESTSDASSYKLIGNYYATSCLATLALAKQLALTRILSKLVYEGDCNLRIFEGDVYCSHSASVYGALRSSKEACEYVAENMSDDVKLVLC